MLGVRKTNVRHGKLQLKFAVTLLTFVVTVALSLMLFEHYQWVVIVPALSICLSFLLFCILLDHRVKTGIIGEVGFIFLGFAIAYSVMPVLSFLAVDFDFPSDFDGLNFSVMNPRPPEIAEHLWRFCLFVVVVIFGYLAARGVDRTNISVRKFGAVNRQVIVILVFLVVSSILVDWIYSAPVNEYIDNYTRFESLSWMERYIVYIALIIKTGMSYVVLTLMFSDYRRYRVAIVIFVVSISAYQLISSLGSRIETLSILLATVSLYHFNVRKLQFKDGAIWICALLIFFTFIEVFRSANFDLDTLNQEISEKGLKIAVEFSAVFYTSFHLYSERLNGTMPPHEWPMLINDFLMAVPFYEHTEFHSQFWYARHYFPQAVVPPQTMGPIADSAIWGGELDLAVRGFLTGLGFGWLARWALRSRDRLFPWVTYVFMYATCVMVVKYSLPIQVSLVLRNVVPAVLLCYVAIRFQSSFSSFKVGFKR